MPLKLFFALILSLFLSACATIKPEKMKRYVSVQLAEGGRTPVVFMFQHSGGKFGAGYRWVQWFKKRGVSTVLINSAGVRGLSELTTVDYGDDLVPALEVVSGNEYLDLKRYAVMGLSKGGTAALTSTARLDNTSPKPDFVFALYPGAVGICPNKHHSSTQVHVFYGELDEWGRHKNTIGACKRMASRKKNAEIHLFPGVHHGYDGLSSGSFSCCGGSWKYEGNSDATDKTREIIEKAIMQKWF